MQHGARLVEGSVSSNLLRLAGPMMVGVLGVMVMNVVDTFFVARLGTTALAALSFTFPVVTVLGSVALGLGVGATSVLARAIGRGEGERVRQVTTDTMLMSVLLVGLLSTAGVLTIAPVFTALGADAETLPLVQEYMSVWYLGMVFLVVPMVGNAAIRATGDAATPARIMVAAALTNMVLDPLFIFTLGLGVRGAAIATVIARALTLLLSLAVLTWREEMISWQRPSWARVRRSWAEVLSIGGPAAATSAVGPLTLGILTGIVARYGPDAVAGFGAGGRAAMLALVPVLALSAAMGPLVGQNWGAGRRDRVGEALGFAARAALGWGLVMWGLLVVLHDPIAQAFSEDPEVLRVIGLFLWIAPAGLGMQGLVGVVGATFNASNQPMKAAALTLLRTPVLSVPLALLGSTWLGVAGIFGGMALSEILTGVAAYVWTRTLREDHGDEVLEVVVR